MSDHANRSVPLQESHNGHVSLKLRPVEGPPKADPPPVRAPAGIPSQRKLPVDVQFDDLSVPAAHYREPTVPLRGTGYLPYRYAVAGLLTIGSQIPLRELEYFREPSLGKGLDIEI